ncbi:hatching enzyme 1.2-like [Clytia hemisphaerica]|uniref:Metalloendopeptidase n=1 Tax=Clytia hemisphaerica TaxID=252671 RepID=A0A7M5WRR4_9CNID
MKTFIVLMFIGMATAWVKEMENSALYQGDILLDPDEDERGLNATNKNTFASIRGGRWPGARVPFILHRSLSQAGVNAIYAAINDFHKYTCLRFQKRTNEPSYILFFKGDGCFSPVGYRYGRQNDVSIGYGCESKGTAIHEIGHSIGLHHEQNRPDRDNFISINWNNIERSMQYNFNKQPAHNIDSKGTGYDYYSIMHYDKGAFAMRYGQITMVTRDPNMQNVIGRGNGFSKTDVIQINRMYCK